MRRSDAVYVVLISVFVTVLVLTNIVGTKLFLLFPEQLPNGLFGQPITLTTGLLTYPITFLVTDVVSEVFGKRRADFMVVLGFTMSMLMLLVVQVALAVPGSPVWVNADLGYSSVPEMETAYRSVFTLPGMLVLGSMTAYLVAQLNDNFLYHRIKAWTKGKHLWLRNNGSTSVSQLLDTIIVNSIFLGGGLGLPFQDIFQITVAVYLCKLVMAFIDTPFIYLGVWAVRRIIRDDVAVSSA